MADYTQLTSLAAAKLIGPSVANGGAATPDFELPDGAVGLLLQAEDQNVRWRVGGTAPTASVGHILFAGDQPYLLLGSQAVRQLKVIEVAASAKLNVTVVYG